MGFVEIANESWRSAADPKPRAVRAWRRARRRQARRASAPPIAGGHAWPQLRATPWGEPAGAKKRPPSAEQRNIMPPSNRNERGPVCTPIGGPFACRLTLSIP